MAANLWRKGGNDTWYYYGSSGKMVTGWETIEGKHYHFDSSSGVMSSIYYIK